MKKREVRVSHPHSSADVIGCLRAKAQVTAKWGPGLRDKHASPLWTLQRLSFGPDVAADHTDREENRDPEATDKTDKHRLTTEMRLENGPFVAR